MFAGKPVLTELWANLNVHFEGVQAGAAAGTDSVNRDYSPEAWARLEKRLDEIYADFTGKVAAGRKLTPDKVEEVAKGQIWSGADAKARGLVDELGGLAMAIKLGQAGSQAGAGDQGHPGHLSARRASGGRASSANSWAAARRRRC